MSISWLLFFACEEDFQSAAQGDCETVSEYIEEDSELSGKNVVIILPQTDCNTCLKSYSQLIESHAFGEDVTFVLINRNAKSRTRFKEVENLVVRKNFKDWPSCVSRNLVTVIHKGHSDRYKISDQMSVEALTQLSSKDFMAETNTIELKVDLLTEKKFKLSGRIMMIEYADRLHEEVRLFTVKGEENGTRGYSIFHSLSEDNNISISSDSLPGGIPYKSFTGISVEPGITKLYYSDGLVQLNNKSGQVWGESLMDHGGYFPPYFMHKVFSIDGGHIRFLSSYENPKLAKIAYLHDDKLTPLFIGPSFPNRGVNLIGGARLPIHTYSATNNVLSIYNADANTLIDYEISKKGMRLKGLTNFSPLLALIEGNDNNPDGSMVEVVNVENFNEYMCLAVRRKKEDAEDIFIVKLMRESADFGITKLNLNLNPEEVVLSCDFVHQLVDLVTYNSSRSSVSVRSFSQYE